LCLLATALVLYKKLIKTVNTRENQLIEVKKHIDRIMSIYEPYKRTIEGHMALGKQDIGPKYLDHLRKNPKEALTTSLIEYVIKQVVKQIVTAIEMELNDNPQYMKITHTAKIDQLLVDFSFPFIVYTGRERMIDKFSRIVETAPDHFTKPPIIKKHF